MLTECIIVKHRKLGCKTWISYEPALESVNWSITWDFIDGLICGGESGNQARPMNPDWARSARDFCCENDIPFFFKQWGQWAPISSLAVGEKTTFKHQPVRFGDEMMVKIGKGLAGHLLDGVEWHQMPGSSTGSIAASRIGTNKGKSNE